MAPVTTLVVYCGLIVLASLAGGWVPIVLRLNHRRLEMLVSFVSGVMLGVAMLHMLPDALAHRGAWIEAQGEPVHAHDLAAPIAGWMLAGLLVMFFVERFFCYHHHDMEDADEGSANGGGGHPVGHHHHHGHQLTWAGAAIGLTLHSLVGGVALAAAVMAGGEHAGVERAAGLGTFLAIVLHKPFDAMTLGTLMAVGHRSAKQRHLVNLAFGLVVPAGAIAFALAAGSVPNGSILVSGALAFSAGTFLCISLSDLLPELQFHQHDRLGLSAALLLGLAVAWGAAKVETTTGAGHDDVPAARSPLNP